MPSTLSFAFATPIKLYFQITYLYGVSIKDTTLFYARSYGWSPDIAVSSRGYMLGYQNLDDPSVNRVYRLLAKIGDGMMKMQIVHIDFNENR